MLAVFYIVSLANMHTAIHQQLQPSSKPGWQHQQQRTTGTAQAAARRLEDSVLESESSRSSLVETAKSTTNVTEIAEHAHCPALVMPDGMDPAAANRKKQRIVEAQDVMAYIVKKLDEQGVPIAIFYGTMLYEYLHGTPECYQPRTSDKDIDLVLFHQHMHLVVDMQQELKDLFGWKIDVSNQDSSFLVLKPVHDTRRQGKAIAASFQIDIYGFQCSSRSPFVDFIWVKVRVRKSFFLPWTPYHHHIQTTSPVHENSTARFHMPYSPECLLAALYGPDFRTPKHGRPAKQKPINKRRKCDTKPLNGVERRVRKLQQRQFCDA